MIRVQVNKDLSTTKDTFLLGLSLRQTISILIGVVLTMIVKIYIFPDLSWFSDEMTYIAIACFVIPLVIGCVPIHGLPFEQFVYNYLPYYLYPRQRLFDDGLGKDKKPHKTKKSRKKKLKKYI